MKRTVPKGQGTPSDKRENCPPRDSKGNCSPEKDREIPREMRLKNGKQTG